MEEAEARRKRLKALREEVQEPEQSYDGMEKLANPLIDAPAAIDSPAAFSFYSDPVGALKASRASMSMQPKQAPTPRPDSGPPGLQAGHRHPYNEHHGFSSGPPVPPFSHHQSMPGSRAMPQPPMHMQWQQGVAAQQRSPGMDPQWHRGPARPPPLMQHMPPPSPPEQWAGPPPIPHGASMGPVGGREGRGRGPQGRGRGLSERGGSRNSGRGMGRQQDRGRKGAFNVEAYYQPSMLEDPWKQLRKQHQHQQPPQSGAVQLSSGSQRRKEVDDSRTHAEGAADQPWH